MAHVSLEALVAHVSLEALVAHVSLRGTSGTCVSKRH